MVLPTSSCGRVMSFHASFVTCFKSPKTCLCNLFHFILFLRFALSGMDMEQRDYDSRTALHVAAAEGTDTIFAVCQLALEYPWCLCASLLLSVQKWISGSTC